MQYGRRYRALLSAFLVVLAAGTARAANLYFLIFAETLDPRIGTIQDFNRASTWARTIESNTGLTLNLQSLSGNDLTPANARRVLQQLSPAADDVVYFVYSGHGVNAGSSKWPTFTFITNTGDPNVTFTEVVSILQPKPQRMLIVMADCCNVVIDGAGRGRPPLEPSADTALTVANFQHLFLGFRGSILATAANVGQYSLGDSAEGGLFLNGFMEDFKSLADTTTDLTWDTVLTTTAADVEQAASAYLSTGELGDIAPQEPQFTIHTEQVAASDPGSPGTSPSAPSGTTTGTPSTTTDSDTGTVAGGSGCGAVGPVPLLVIALGLFAITARKSGKRVSRP